MLMQCGKYAVISLELQKMNLLRLGSHGCGMQFRRITEICEVDPEPFIPLPKPWNSRPKFGEVSLKAVFGPSPPPLKRKHENFETSELASFKRIRLISRLERPRRAAFCRSLSGAYIANQNSVDETILTNSASNESLLESTNIEPLFRFTDYREQK